MSKPRHPYRPRVGKKPTAANLRSWRVIIIRSKGEYLGSSKLRIARG
jgi:hypothetical protein